MKEITSETVNTFLNGHDPMERIVDIECDYMDDYVSVIYVNENGQKMIHKDGFKPFLWAKNSVCVRMFDGNRLTLRRKLKEYGIGVKLLTYKTEDSEFSERLENGYKYLFYSRRKCSYQQFMNFFREAGTPIYEKPKKDEDQKDGSKEFLTCTPVEQYMIESGKRLFKGYDNYDDLNRLQFDIETTGLNPYTCHIEQIGIRNKKNNFEKVINVKGEGEELRKNELKAIDEFLYTLSVLKPDVIAGHNSENFDWNFFMVRAKVDGSDFGEMSKKYFKHPIYKKKKESILKLGGEMEFYRPTIMWGHNILDSLHAARRAQAIDSSMKKSTLKYVCKYLKLTKPNRVYVPGNVISKIWNEMEENYAFNDKNGDWYKVDLKHPLKEGYVMTSGEYIVKRYLLDDIWETDQVELKLNESNFLVGKMIPTTFSRACTMGTAGIWKLIMLAWCYENELAVPATAPNKRFTGGLSRLLKTGYVSRIVKLDYNSLYPSIILTWNIATPLDITHIMLHLLEYILTQREKYKGLKAEAGKKAEELSEEFKEKKATLSPDEVSKAMLEIQKWQSEKMANDKKQLPLKIFGNSFFGSYGCPMIFPFGDIDAAEMTTCIGRMSLRLMISHFTNLGYMPIVGDTDGFNFSYPTDDKFRYTDEHPYISNGKGRNSVYKKKYVKVEADVCEFEDTYFNHPWNGGINKMGLGIDEYCDACIQFARKNYADLMPDGKTKKVGNTIKSRKMSGYLEKFIDVGVDQLLHGDGYDFLEGYYEYISKIYNYQIPIKDIASKGKIKKTIEEYKADCQSVTKAGNKKSRQAWYELVIKNNINVNVSDTIYYINTGKKLSDKDVKRVTHQYVKVNGEEKLLDTKTTKELLVPICQKKGIEYKNLKTKDKKEMIKPFITREEDEIILNSQLVPAEILNSDEDVLCSDIEGLEYNVDKYIDQFNKRITPLLVCFSPEIRNDIIITNPNDRKFFTKEQTKLVCGYPNKESDQDTYEALMTPERKEIEFWLKVGKVPPFVKECGIDWDKLVEDYKIAKKDEDNALFQEENEKYLKALDALTPDDIDAFMEDGKIPSSLASIVTMDSTMHFYFKKIPNKTPTTGGFVFDDIVPSNIETSE